MLKAGFRIKCVSQLGAKFSGMTRGRNEAKQIEKKGKIMAGSINKVILVGNLGRDPEVRHTNSGTKIVHLSVATSDSWKDKSTGERQEKTEWHRVVVFNTNLGDFAEKYLKKGSKVYVEGALQTRKYTDSSGVEKYSTEVVLGAYRGELVSLDARLGSGNGDVAGAASVGAAATGSGWDSLDAKSDKAATFDDEIPF